MLIIAVIGAVLLTLFFSGVSIMDLVLFTLKKGYYSEEKRVYSKEQQVSHVVMDFALLSMGLFMEMIMVYLLQKSSILLWNINPTLLFLLAIFFFLLGSFLFSRSRFDESEKDNLKKASSA